MVNAGFYSDLGMSMIRHRDVKTLVTLITYLREQFGLFIYYKECAHEP